MEQETILYYYPMPEITAGPDHRYAAKRHWFADAVLPAGIAAKQEAFCVLGCEIPPFYYRRRPWKAQVLSSAMETVLSVAEGMTDTYVHPAVQTLLTEAYCERWTPRAGTIQILGEHLLAEYTKDAFAHNGMVTVLLGQPADTDLQMQMTWKLLQPYLARVNRMQIYYEETAGVDIEEELQEYLESYYYEYGLVPQFCKRREKCGGVILDYCEQFQYPKIIPEGCVYIDLTSAAEKEQICRRKGLSIPYVSPLKYLDTVVKNSYDRKVNKFYHE